MITRERMAAVDLNAEALGIPRRQLMESSGNAIARVVREEARPGDRVVVVAGRGNNGGDGFVAARFLDDFDVRVALLGRAETITTSISRANWDALVRAEYETYEVLDSNDFDLPPCDVIVDAVLGTGVTGAVREPAATAVDRINDRDATVISVDVPSGIDADTGEGEGPVVEADRIVTFHDEKPGLSTLDVPVTVADIGIPEAATRFVGPGDLITVRTASRSARVFVIGGGPYTGAPALAAQAALRAGAELSFVAAPTAVAGEIQGYAEDLIVQPFEGDFLTTARVDGLVETARSYDDIVVLGPGLGTEEETLDATRLFLEVYDGPIVVDADALSVVPNVETDATLVCTPNRRELAMMGGPDAADLREVADEIEAFAGDLGHVVLAKGEDDVITDGERTRIVRTGTPAMAVGGTGDVLSGISATLLESHEPFKAACIAAYVNGRAGELAAERGHNGILASEVLGHVPEALWGGDR